MRLGQLITPEATTLTIGSWSRAEIETAIECLIELLDTDDASPADLEPEVEMVGGPVLPANCEGAETDQPLDRFRVGRRLRR